MPTKRHRHINVIVLALALAALATLTACRLIADYPLETPHDASDGGTDAKRFDAPLAADKQPNLLPDEGQGDLLAPLPHRRWMNSGNTISHIALAPITGPAGETWTYPANFFFGNKDQALCLSVLGKSSATQRFTIWGTRASTTEPFDLTTFTKIPGLDRPGADEGATTFTSDLREIWVSAGIYGKPVADLWHASRNNTYEDFVYDASPLTISSSTYDNDVILSASSLNLYYAKICSIEGTSGLERQRIFIATRPAATLPFTAPSQQISTLNAYTKETDYGDADPSLSSDERIIVFTSTRGSAQDSKHHLFYAVRSAIGAPFGAPKRLPGFSNDDDVFEPGLSGDGEELFFCTRDSTTGIRGCYFLNTRK